MYNIAMALISALNLFWGIKGMGDYLACPDWKGAVGPIVSFTLSIWVILQAISEARN